MKKWKQILCLIGVIVLVGLYLITLIFSFTDHTQAKSWLSASLYATVIIPVFLYAFFLICRPLSDRKQECEKILKDSEAASVKQNRSEAGGSNTEASSKKRNTSSSDTYKKQ